MTSSVHCFLWRTAALTVAVIYLTLSGCSNEADDSRTNALVIWINGDKGYNGLAKVGEKFTEATGIKVIVEHPENATDKFQQAAKSGGGPDIFLWAHDRLGEWKAGGLVAEVRPSARIKAAVEQKGWDGFTIGGRIWGYPVAFEAASLVYNKTILPVPPRTFEEIPALHDKLRKDGKSAILWDFKNTYFTWGLLAAQGGYPFKRMPDGTYDPDDIGVNNEGALAGLQMLDRFIKDGVMDKGARYADMEAGVAKGTIAMMINGPWSWANLEMAKVDFGIAPLPTLGGEPFKPFVGVLGAMVSQASENKQMATEFIERYLLTPENLKLIDDDKQIGVPALKAFYKQRSDDARIVATMLNVKHGILMPNNPEMGKFWDAMEPALESIAQRRQTPREALDAAAKRILGSDAPAKP